MVLVEAYGALCVCAMCFMIWSFACVAVVCDVCQGEGILCLMWAVQRHCNMYGDDVLVVMLAMGRVWASLCIAPTMALWHVCV